MSASPAPAAPSSRPDPHQDRPATGGDAPSRTGRLLGLVRKLIDYGKELAGTLQQHASAANLAIVTRNFGTADIAAILACITRGLLRAAALQARIVSRPTRPEAAPARTSAPSHRQPRAAQPAAPRADDADSRLARLPTPGHIAAEIRRRPIAAVLADICLDLGIMPSDPLWRELSSVITEHGGSVGKLFRDTAKRVWIPVADPFASIVPPMPPGWRAPRPQSPAASGTDPP